MTDLPVSAIVESPLVQLKRAEPRVVTVGEPAENAKIIKEILTGELGPKRDIVLLNAAAGIVVGGKAATLKDGLKLAVESVDSGSALNILNQLVG